MAELAGVPREVNQRAMEILEQLEQQHETVSKAEDCMQRRDTANSLNGHHMQMTLFETIDHPLMEEIRQTDLNSLTPLEVQQLVQQWQRQLAGENSIGRPC